MSRFTFLLTTMFLLGASLSGNAQMHDPKALDADPTTATSPIAPRLTGLGHHSMPITTDKADSQYFFDQGLRLTYGFNHSEALRAFKEAVRLDPNNAMAYWGWALVLGPNINLPMQAEVEKRAYEAAQTAFKLRHQVSEKERILIETLALRYTNESKQERASLDQVYADAMARVYARYPDDVDIATLYASALMNLSPWNYWDGDGRPYDRTRRVMDILEPAMLASPGHTGSRHYYIHIVEKERPELGERAADELALLAPGAGHLVHMPSHIYMRIGRYADSYRANALASQADEGYIAQCRAQGIYPLGYYPHNVHFLVWSAMYQGRSADAMKAARKVHASIPAAITGDGLRSFEQFLSQPIVALVRFGKWQDVLAESKPPESSKYWTGIWHYARGLAFNNMGKRSMAQKELGILRKLAAEEGMDSYVTFASDARSLLNIASAILAGDIASRRGRHDEAVASLSRAVRLQGALTYSEPPEWYFPSRHYLGAVLLEAKRPAEAEVVYWEDLREHPENAYSLLGLAQALQQLGRDEQASDIMSRFKQAWGEADVQLGSSRF